MSPLQKIAMGMVIVVGSALFPAQASPPWQRYDALADPLGWVLVLLGTFALTRSEDQFASTRWLAGLAGVVSVPVWFPQLSHLLEPSGQWFVSLPQIAFCLHLARSIGMAGAVRVPRDGYVAKRFGLLTWGFTLVGVLPVLVFGAGLEALRTPTALISGLVNVVFVYHLFRVHRREWLGGPGPLQIRPRDRSRR